jgi:hypothetical protein
LRCTLALLILLTLPATSQEVLSPDAVQRVQEVATLVQVLDGEEVLAGGSGLLLRADDRHGLIVAGAELVEVALGRADAPLRVGLHRDRTHRFRPAQLVGLPHESSLALLAVEDDDLPAPYAVSPQGHVGRGETAWIVAFPFGGQIEVTGEAPATVARCRIEAMRPDGGGLLLSGDLQAGHTGAPVLDAHGGLLGIAAVTTRGHARVVPLEQVQRLAAETPGFLWPRLEVAGSADGTCRLHLVAHRNPLAASPHRFRQVQALHRALSELAKPVWPDADGRWPALPGATATPLQGDRAEIAIRPADLRSSHAVQARWSTGDDEWLAPPLILAIDRTAEGQLCSRVRRPAWRRPTEVGPAPAPEGDDWLGNPDGPQPPQPVPVSPGPPLGGHVGSVSGCRVLCQRPRLPDRTNLVDVAWPAGPGADRWFALSARGQVLALTDGDTEEVRLDLGNVGTYRLWPQGDRLLVEMTRPRELVVLDGKTLHIRKRYPLGNPHAVAVPQMGRRLVTSDHQSLKIHDLVAGLIERRLGRADLRRISPPGRAPGSFPLYGCRQLWVSPDGTDVLGIKGGYLAHVSLKGDEIAFEGIELPVDRDVAPRFSAHSRRVVLSMESGAIVVHDLDDLRTPVATLQVDEGARAVGLLAAGGVLVQRGTDLHRLSLGGEELATYVGVLPDDPDRPIALGAGGRRLLTCTPSEVWLVQLPD